MPQTGRLKVQGHGNAEVELVAAYLTDLTESDLAPLLNELVIKPLNALGAYQDSNNCSDFQPSRRPYGPRFPR
jgi:hypothetical protein